MFILGLVLIGVGAVLVVAALFTAEVSGGQLEFLGLEVGAFALFLLGVAAGLAILFGYSITKLGARRSLRQRREHRRLSELSEKLGRVESKGRGEQDDQRPNRS